MIKPTKKELYKALHLACFEKIRDNLPNGKCIDCVANYVIECPKCWMKYYLNKSKENNDELKGISAAVRQD